MKVKMDAKKTDCLVRDWLMEQVSECRPFLLLLWWAMHSLPGFHRLLSTVLMLTIHDWTIVFLGIWCTFVVYLLTTSVCQHLITSHQLSPQSASNHTVTLHSQRPLARSSISFLTNFPRETNAQHLCSSGGQASDDLSFLAFVLSVLSISQWVILTSPGFCVFW